MYYHLGQSGFQCWAGLYWQIFFLGVNLRRICDASIRFGVYWLIVSLKHCINLMSCNDIVVEWIMPALCGRFSYVPQRWWWFINHAVTWMVIGYFYDMQADIVLLASYCVSELAAFLCRWSSFEMLLHSVVRPFRKIRASDLMKPTEVVSGKETCPSWDQV